MKIISSLKTNSLIFQECWIKWWNSLTSSWFFGPISNCLTFPGSLGFLGCVATLYLYPYPSKTAAVINYKELQSFLELTGYFRKFIFNFSVIALPFSDLLKKNVHFYFGEEQKIAFNELKRTLSSKLLFTIYN